MDPAAGRRAARSPSCSARRRLRATCSCGRSASGAPPRSPWRCCRPRAVADLEAYSAGVNAYVASHPLPAEYAALELTRLPALERARQRRRDQAARVRPLLRHERHREHATADRLPDGARPGRRHGAVLPGPDAERAVRARAVDPAGRDLRRARDAREAGLVELVPRERHARAGEGGEGEARRCRRSARRPTPARTSGSSPARSRRVAGRWSPATRTSRCRRRRRSTRSGSARSDLVLYGVTFPGAPSVVHGMNEHIAWGSTVNPTDVTDVYQETVVRRADVPVATIFRGAAVPTQIFPQSYRANQPGNGDARRPRRGAAVGERAADRGRDPARAADRARTSASSSPASTRPASRTTSASSRAPANVADAKRALRYFDFGAQNWMFADDSGNIAYYTDREVPLREDLQAGTVDGLPPYFIRDGTGTLRHEWIPKGARPESHAIPFEILPDAELDQLVNPARGWISNANQDPTGQTFDNDPLNELRPGGGILYLSPGHEDGNRNTRITARIGEALADGSDLVRRDAVDPGGREAERRVGARAVDRLRAAGGADARRAGGARRARRRPEGAGGGGAARRLGLLDADRHRRRATTRATWTACAAPPSAGRDRRERCGDDLQPVARSGARGDRRRPARGGRARRLHAEQRPGDDGAPAAARVERDRRLRLPVLRRAGRPLAAGARRLEERARPGSKPGVRPGVRRLDDSRRLPLGAGCTGSRSRTCSGRRSRCRRAAGSRTSVPGLPGVATDGGFAVVDASSHNPRAASLNGFRFASGPARRFVAETQRSHPERRPGHAGRRERQPLRAVLRQPDRALADGRLPPRDRAGGRDRERRDLA